MKRLLLILIVSTFVQTLAQANVYTYRVYLDGKPDSRLVELTERARVRRQQQQVGIEETDYQISASYLQQLTDAGLIILVQSRWLNTIVVRHKEGGEMTDAQWSALPFVKKVEMLTQPERTRSSVRRASKRADETTTTSAVAEDCTTPLFEVNAYDAIYQAGHRGKDKLIAVFDGGFHRLNECPWLMEKVAYYYDFYHPSSPESVFVGDNHGIQCMSIMASPEAHGVCGTAQEARFCLFNTENGDFESAIEEDMWVAAAEMADSLGVDVISSSLGYCEYDDNLMSHTHDELGKNTVFISKGAKIAAQKGMLVVNSSGNYGNKSWEKILFPADTEEVLTIGAYKPTLDPADFTSQGFLTPYVKPDVAARGQNCYSIVPTDTGFYARSRAAGTSFSTPLIAGLCASLWSAVPELTPAEIRQVVNESATDYNAPDILTGYGLPDFSVALKKAQEMKGHSSIEQIKAEAADRESAASMTCYDLMGQPLVTPPSKGLYIRNGRKVIAF